MDGAGFVFFALGLILFAFGHWLSLLVDIFDVAGWACEILAALLFAVRPLLWLRWWRSWIAFFSLGSLLLVLALCVDWPYSRVETIRLVASIAGLYCTVIGCVFSVTQWLVRRGENRVGLGRPATQRIRGA